MQVFRHDLLLILSSPAGLGYSKIPNTQCPCATGRGVSLRGGQAHRDGSSHSERVKVSCGPCVGKVKFKVLVLQGQVQSPSLSLTPLLFPLPPPHPRTPPDRLINLEKKIKALWFPVPHLGPQSPRLGHISSGRSVPATSKATSGLSPMGGGGVRPCSAAPAHAETLPRSSHSRGTPVHTTALCRAPFRAPITPSPRTET